MAPKSVWAIDIGSSAVRAVKLVRSGEQIKLADYDIRELSYVGREEDKILDAIRKALIGLAGRKSLIGQRVIISVPGSLSFQRVVKIPPCPKGKIAEIMGYEAQQQIPFKLNEVVWDYEQVSSDADVSGGRKIALFAVKKSVLEPLLKYCEEAMMRVIGVQLSHIAVLNLLNYELRPEKPVAVLNVGARFTELMVLDKHDVWLRPLPFAGIHMTEAVAERNRSSFMEAEEEKRSILAGETHVAAASVEPAIRNLVAEAQRSLGFFRSQYSGINPESLFLTGRGFAFTRGIDALGSELRIPIFQPGAPVRIAYSLVGSDDVFVEDCRQLTVALGLALQGLGEARFSTNLLPEDRILDNFLADKRLPVLGGLIVLWIAALLTLFSLSSRLDAAKTGEKNMRTAVEKVGNNKKKLAEVLEKLPAKILLAKNLASYSNGRVSEFSAYNDVIVALNGARRDGYNLWIKTLDINDVTRRKLDEWAASLGNITITNVETFVLWKANANAINEKEQTMLAAFEPSRISRWLECSLKGEAVAGIGAEKLVAVEALRTNISKTVKNLKSIRIATDWKEVSLEIPSGTTPAIEFNIVFEIEIPPLDTDFQKPVVESLPEEEAGK